MDPNQHDNILNTKLIKRGGKLVHTNTGNLAIYQQFVDGLQEGQVVQVFFEGNKDDGTNAQLARIHVCIRKLAQETGFTFEEMKLEIKRRAGLTYGDLRTSEGFAKSFADCSKEELGLVIEAINEAGSIVNIMF